MPSTAPLPSAPRARRVSIMEADRFRCGFCGDPMMTECVEAHNTEGRDWPQGRFGQFGCGA